MDDSITKFKNVQHGFILNDFLKALKLQRGLTFFISYVSKNKVKGYHDHFYS